MWFERNRQTPQRLFKMMVCSEGMPLASGETFAVSESEATAAADGLADDYIAAHSSTRPAGPLHVYVFDEQGRFLFHRAVIVEECVAERTLAA